MALTGDESAGRSRRAGRMNTAVYTRYELLRAFRNRRVFIFSLRFR